MLGVDEHTAVLIDRGAETVEVSGVGTLTVRRHGAEEHLPAGTSMSIDELRSVVAGVLHVPGGARPSVAAGAPDATGSDEGPAGPATQATQATQPSLDADVARQRAQFDAAMVARDVDAAVEAVLALDDALAAWSADTLQSDALDRGRRELRAMVVRLGELARSGAADPKEALAPVVEAVLAARQSARAAKDFATSDVLRDALLAGGVEVKDTPEGATWSLAQGTSAADTDGH